MITASEFVVTARDTVAGVPTEYLGKKRSDVKLLRIVGSSGSYSIQPFASLSRFLQTGDVLVFNNSKMIPSSFDGYLPRLREFVRLNIGYEESGYIVELRNRQLNFLEGDRIVFQDGSHVELGIRDNLFQRYWRVGGSENFNHSRLSKGTGRFITYGELAPQYPAAIYDSPLSTIPGSVEYPSASRPFTNEVLDELKLRGVDTAYITLHCNLGSLDASEFTGKEFLLPEWFKVLPSQIEKIEAARDKGGRIIAVGTTTVRALSSIYKNGHYSPSEGYTRLFIKGTRVNAADAIITGMHDPTTSHMHLISGFSEMGLIRAAYDSALDHGFLWHEFGDISLIERE